MYLAAKIMSLSEKISLLSTFEEIHISIMIIHESIRVKYYRFPKVSLILIQKEIYCRLHTSFPVIVELICFRKSQILAATLVVISKQKQMFMMPMAVHLSAFVIILT